MIRITIFWGLCWGPLILGKYHLSYLALGLRVRVQGLGLGRAFMLQGLGV